jgi:hypothetical protein
MVLVFTNRASYDAIKADIVATPDIEGGIGPVLFGQPLVGADGRCAISHPWSEVDGDWLTAYTSGENPPMQILTKLPTDWQFPKLI